MSISPEDRSIRPAPRPWPGTRGIILAGCLAMVTPLPAQWSQEEQGSFEGYWAVSGTVHVLEFEDGQLAAAGGFTGTVTLQTSEGPVPSFETDCVAFADDRGGSVGRCIWTGITGDQVHVELQGSGPAGFGAVRGKFTGGTGRFQRASGSFAFEWNYSVSRGRDATLDGHTVQMAGRYALR